jgi:hypothetical protein
MAVAARDIEAGSGESRDSDGKGHLHGWVVLGCSRGAFAGSVNGMSKRWRESMVGFGNGRETVLRPQERYRSIEMGEVPSWRV